MEPTRLRGGDDGTEWSGKGGEVPEASGWEVAPVVAGVPVDMQVAVEEGLPAPEPVECSADVEVSSVECVGELVAVEQPAVATGQLRRAPRPLVLTER